jgi:hypothetical protein
LEQNQIELDIHASEIAGIESVVKSVATNFVTSIEEATEAIKRKQYNVSEVGSNLKS